MIILIFILKIKEAINFEIANHQCRGDPITKTEKEHKTVCTNDIKNYPKDEKKKALSSVFRNKRLDLWVKRDLMIDYFFKKISTFNLL